MDRRTSKGKHDCSFSVAVAMHCDMDESFYVYVFSLTLERL